MNVTSKARNVLRRVMQSWGSGGVKRALWNREFGEGRWDHLGETPGDPVYTFVERYAAGGSILDLGCGSGNTGNELAAEAYSSYLGIDVSDVALCKAMARTEANDRTHKNAYARADIVSYRPHARYDVILFRESLNYVPQPHVVGMLKRYLACLAPSGVIIVRLYDRHRHRALQALLQRHFVAVEEFVAADDTTLILVLR